MANRVVLIDVAKGLSIILVAFGHSHFSVLMPELNAAFSLFRMPLFFFLSGVFFSSLADFKRFFIHKTDALLKPYFVTLLFLLCVSAISGDINIKQEFLGVLSGNGEHLRWSSLWFLPHLWSVFIFSYVLFRVVKGQCLNRYSQALLVGLLFLAGSFITENATSGTLSILGFGIAMEALPFSLDVLFLSSAYFLLGRFMYQPVMNFKPCIVSSLIAVVLLLLIVFYSRAYIDLNNRVYNEPLLASLAAFAGIYIMMVLSFYLAKTPVLKKWVTAFGVGSLFVLIFHEYIGIKSYMTLMQWFGTDMEVILAIVSFLISITVPLFIRYVVRKNSYLKPFYFPLKLRT